MSIDRRVIGVALGVALAVAACGGSASSPSSSSAAASSAAAPASAAADTSSPSEAASSAASEAPSASMPDISLAPGAASDLEAMLPSSIGSVTFQKTSMDGSQIAGAGTPLDTSKMDPMLSKYGKSIADVRLAFATGNATVAGGLPEMVYAIQLKGVPASDWIGQLDSSATGTPTTIGGKSVLATSQGGMTTGYYTKDDIAFLVVASDKDAQAIFAALP